jgi:hypothetical protein
MQQPLRKVPAMFRTLLVSSFSIFVLAACAGADGSQVADTSDDNVEAIKVACGGIAGIQCPAKYDCVIKSNHPDAMGTCEKRKVCIQNVMCAKNGHFDHDLCKCVPNTCVQTQACMKDSHWDSVTCGCVADVSCKTLTCVKNYHCEEKGINGGTIPVCIHN